MVFVHTAAPRATGAGTPPCQERSKGNPKDPCSRRLFLAWKPATALPPQKH